VVLRPADPRSARDRRLRPPAPAASAHATRPAAATCRPRAAGDWDETGCGTGGAPAVAVRVIIGPGPFTQSTHGRGPRAVPVLHRSLSDRQDAGEPPAPPSDTLPLAERLPKCRSPPISRAGHRVARSAVSDGTVALSSSRGGRRRLARPRTAHAAAGRVARRRAVARGPGTPCAVVRGSPLRASANFVKTLDKDGQRCADSDFVKSSPKVRARRRPRRPG
jgi:hypothetical protein